VIAAMRDSLIQVYSAKSDEELLSLTADPNSLTEEARPLLAEELLRRNLVAPLAAPAAANASTEFLNTPLGKFLRAAGSYVGSLAIAIFGTNAIAAEVSIPMGHASSLAAMETKHLLLGVTIGALLGFFVNRYRPTKTAVWVWIVPIALLLYRIFLYSTRTTSVLFGDSISQHFLAPSCLDHIAECLDFTGITIPTAQTVAYSLAAWISLRFVSRTSVETSK
jgi:hypothetical protein